MERSPHEIDRVRPGAVGLMGDLIALDDRLGRRVRIAVDDELFQWLPEPRSFEVGGVRVEYVAASTLTDPDREADLWVGRYAPTAPDRSLLFQTSGAQYEADPLRRVWRAGELVHPGALVDFGVPTTNERGILRSGQPAALLFMSPAEGGWHLRVRVTTPLLLVARLPARADRFAPPPHWLSLARRLLRAQDGEA